MFVVRDVFRLKFGKFKEARMLLQQAMKDGLFQNAGFRFYSDFTGDSYRLIFEVEFNDLHSYEQTLMQEMSTKPWQDWYAQFIPLIDSSNREILKKIIL